MEFKACRDQWALRNTVEVTEQEGESEKEQERAKLVRVG